MTLSYWQLTHTAVQRIGRNLLIDFISKVIDSSDGTEDPTIPSFACKHK